MSGDDYIRLRGSMSLAVSTMSLFLPVKNVLKYSLLMYIYIISVQVNSWSIDNGCNSTLRSDF
jgi:hypothetical protein